MHDRPLKASVHPYMVYGLKRGNRVIEGQKVGFLKASLIKELIFKGRVINKWIASRVG